MDTDYSPVAAKLNELRARIAELARESGRAPDNVRLIAISKTHPATAIAAAMAAGQMEFGENAVQEALAKIPDPSSRGAVWHFIGHLQSNKARFIPGNFRWLHSLDSAKIAQRLSRFAQEKSSVVETLIEVNITRDPNKHGVAPEALAPLLDELLKAPLPGIRLRGLMAMGPYPATEPEMRAAFAAVRGLRDDCQRQFGLPQFTELSMGMSGDYAEAIKEGSTMVRIGTAIFGERDYSKPSLRAM